MASASPFPAKPLDGAGRVATACAHASRSSLATINDNEPGTYSVRAPLADRHPQIGRRSSSPVFRSAGALSSPLSVPATRSAERRNLAARARHWLGQGIPVQAKGLDQLASEFVADLGHLSASPAVMSGLNTLNKAGVAGNEVPNFW